MTTANRYGIDSMFYTGNSPWQGVGTPWTVQPQQRRPSWQLDWTGRWDYGVRS